jgi:arylsulfatase A-like enzyme
MTVLTRREFLGKAAIGLSAAYVLPRAAWAGPAAGNEKPNLVLVMADDMGWGDLAANGSNKFVKTPELDAMAAAGLRLTRCYATSPQCVPTRMGVLSGRHPSRYGVFAAEPPGLPAEVVTSAEVLGKMGYATGHFGKWHIGAMQAGAPTSPGGQGFQTWYSIANSYMVHKMDVTFQRNGRAEKSKGYCETAIMDEALKFIRASVTGKKPFLAVIWNMAPHDPHLAPDDCRAFYAHLPEAEQHYWGMITAIDREVGRLRRELRALGVAENTLVFFSSDNGGTRYSSAHDPFQGGKGGLFEGGLRVPGIIEWPAHIPQGRLSDIPVNLMDSFPTCLAAAGAPAPEGLDGLNLLPLIAGEWRERPAPMAFHFLDQNWQSNMVRKPDFFTSIGHYGFAVVDNRWKLIASARGDAVRLFDVVEDVGEKKDLAAAKPEVVKRLQDWRTQWWTSVVTDLQRMGFVIDPETRQPKPEQPVRQRRGSGK